MQIPERIEDDDLRIAGDVARIARAHQEKEQPELPLFVTEPELAQMLRVSASKLRKMRLSGEGRLPPHYKFGSQVRYAASDVADFITSSRIVL